MLAASELGRSREQAVHEDPQVPMASALQGRLMMASGASCSALCRFRCYVRAGNRAGLRSECLLTVLLGYTEGRRLKTKRIGVQHPDYFEKKKKKSLSAVPLLPCPFLH